MCVSCTCNNIYYDIYLLCEQSFNFKTAVSVSVSLSHSLSLIIYAQLKCNNA